MKRVKVEDAVGKPLAHDVVRYGPGLKTVLFKRGYVVTAADVERLKDVGDHFVYVEEGEYGDVHEDEAAVRMARASTGTNISFKKPHSGKVQLIAEKSGLLKVKAGVVKKVNLVDNFIVATRPNHFGVTKGQVVGSVKIIPLTVAEDELKKVESVLEENKPVITVVLPKIEKIAAIITGTEVYEGRVKDAFLPVLTEKLKSYGLGIGESIMLPDDREKISEAILKFKETGYELILVAGGMAVDTTDVTPGAIRNTGAEVISRGVPTFPGSMTMVAYLGDTAIIGLPACVIPDCRTSFDLLLPLVLAKERITREDIAEFGHGGLLAGYER